MRLALLADGSLGAQALAFLASTGQLAAVAWGPGDPACREWVQQQCTAQDIPFQALSAVEVLAPWLEPIRPDLGIVFGFPKKLPLELLNLPRLGWVNLHGGPLPAYRGPQPVFWQIRNQERTSALVAHRMDAGLDTGPVIAALPLPLGPDATYGSLTQALAQAAPSLLQHLLQALATQGERVLDAAPPQGEGKSWPRPGMDDVHIRWSTMDAAEIQALVRACNPWNSGAWSSLQGQPCRLVAVTPATLSTQAQPEGSVHLLEDGGLAVTTCDGLALRLEILRLEEGFFTGPQLRAMGIGPGAHFA